MLKKILGVYEAPRPHWVGNGFPVRSLFSYGDHGKALSPFLLLDHAGPHHFTPTTGRRGVGAHPHRGFETVTIVYEGEVTHRDSTGAGGTIGPGDVQWMTAASGILHEEFHSEAYARTGGPFEMVQLWVNLPAKDKMSAPGYQTLLNSDIPELNLPNGAGTVRVIAGDYGQGHGPARTFTPINVWDVRIKAGATTELQAPPGHTLALVVLHGTVLINGTEVARAGQLVHMDRAADTVHLEANNEVALLWLSGEPIDEPVVGHGPFVMNTAQEIDQAMDDLRSGQFGRIPAAKQGQPAELNH
ncbi:MULTISPECIES: pirin family protein [unclassified Comamonas]|uniref:pirin family protein n=1 Tax=unclassified Comamonas TaxID=2638500 RepID=UPI00177D4BCD|nr:MULTISPECIES: pirin family protein [unclassified Comamonas]MBD9400367.1 pirin family protein [Comamonas sp. CMM02]